VLLIREEIPSVDVHFFLVDVLKSVLSYIDTKMTC
jgi:hypothetical protein